MREKGKLQLGLSVHNYLHIWRHLTLDPSSNASLLHWPPVPTTPSPPHPTLVKTLGENRCLGPSRESLYKSILVRRLEPGSWACHG